MKKLFAVVFCMVIFLCGCAKEKSVRISAESAEFQCEINTDCEKYVAAVKTDRNLQTVNARVLSPEAVKGTSYILKNGNITVEYNGIKKSLENDIAYKNIPLKFIKIMLDFNGKTAVEANGNFEFNGKFNDSDYKVFVSPVGTPLSIHLKLPESSAEIKNFTLVK